MKNEIFYIKSCLIFWKVMKLMLSDMDLAVTLIRMAPTENLKETIYEVISKYFVMFWDLMNLFIYRGRWINWRQKNGRKILWKYFERNFDTYFHRFDLYNHFNFYGIFKKQWSQLQIYDSKKSYNISIIFL